MLNHSCRPNLWSTVTDSTITLAARRAIHTGEELRINYVTDPCGYPGMPWALREERQAYLLKFYGFPCDCELCREGCPFVESALCGQCGGDARPRAGGGAGTVCKDCGMEEAGASAPGAMSLSQCVRGRGGLPLSRVKSTHTDTLTMTACVSISQADSVPVCVQVRGNSPRPND